MKNQFIEFVSEGNFEGARELIRDFPPYEMEEYLLVHAYETGSLLPYSFVCSLLAIEETSALHYSASIIMSQPLCHMNDAYKVSLFHARKALQLSPEDLSLKMYLLLFNHIPEKLIPDSEALQIANDILSVDPQNELARQQLLR